MEAVGVTNGKVIEAAHKLRRDLVVNEGKSDCVSGFPNVVFDVVSVFPLGVCQVV